MGEQDDNWFGSWFNAARDKGSKVFEFVKKDLEEFGSAVRNEATSVVSSTGSVLEKTLNLDSPDSTASSVKRSVSSFLGQVNNVLNPSPDDSDTEAILIGEDSETLPLTSLQKALYDLQKDAGTFTTDPEERFKQQFECWLEIIEDQLAEERLNKHLRSSEILRKQYETFVPETVPHTLFWKRYLFKKALLEDNLAHEEALQKKEKIEKTKPANVQWDAEEFASYIELTEDEQTKLLQEYEKEIRVKEIKETIPQNCDNKNETNLEQEMQNSQPKPTEKIDSALNLVTSSSNSSTDDGEWEKISDVDK